MEIGIRRYRFAIAHAISVANIKDSIDRNSDEYPTVQVLL